MHAAAAGAAAAAAAAAAAPAAAAAAPSAAAAASAAATAADAAAAAFAGLRGGRVLYGRVHALNCYRCSLLLLRLLQCVHRD